MKESISDRIRRVITGTANSLVSKIEGVAPEIILKEAINEVDDALDEVRAELGKITAQKHHVTKAISKLNNEHSQLEDQIELAHKNGRKDLIEAAFSREVDIEDQIPALENQLSDLSSQEKDLNQAVSGIIAKRNEMEDELFEFMKTQSATKLDSEMNIVGSEESNISKANKAERTFNRVIGDATGVRKSILKTTEENAKLVELAHLNRKARIEAKMKTLESK